MAFKKLVAPSLTELFVNELEGLILTGKLKPGEKLPPERQLAEEMDVSLAVINGGIQRLAVMGFLRVVPRQGIFVDDYVRNGNMDTMIEVMNYRKEVLDEDILRAIIDFRRSLELSAVRLACENRTEESLAIMEELSARAAEEKENFPEIGFAFQHEISIASGNAYIPMITRTFKPVYITFYQKHLSVSCRADMAQLLRKLYAAVRDRDVEESQRLINQSVDNWIASLEND